MKTALLLSIFMVAGVLAPNTNVQDSFNRDLMRGFDSSSELRATFSRDIYHAHH